VGAPVFSVAAEQVDCKKRTRNDNGDYTGNYNGNYNGVNG